MVDVVPVWLVLGRRLDAHLCAEGLFYQQMGFGLGHLFVWPSAITVASCDHRVTGHEQAIWEVRDCAEKPGTIAFNTLSASGWGWG